MMISFTVRMKFKPEDRHDIIEALQGLAGASRQEPGCVTYIPHTLEADPDTVLIYEQYVDEAALEHHRNSPHFQQYAAGALYKLKHTRQMEYLRTVD